MYAKEMRQNYGKRDACDVDGGGGGDALKSHLEESQQSSDTDHDDFALAYGNYGNPYSFAPYQLILLLIDFILNWAMDLTHEFPLAVLVIFIFQTLSVILNLILYIMASASQAMQVGLQRRVTIHHWLNLCTCLCYLSLTAWWFIWALRKSWPSVSDQFSFTWPATDLEQINRSLSASLSSTSNPDLLPKSLNSTQSQSQPNPSQVKEHYSLWSPGFNALYVIHRTLAIVYYFIYLRAIFLVLNTPAMNKFIERKKSLVEKFEEAKKLALEPNLNDGDSGRNERSTRKLTSSKSFPLPSSVSLGLSEYLSEKTHPGYFMESEETKTKSSRKSERRQILWADHNDNDDRMNVNEEGMRDEEPEPEPIAQPKPKKRNSKGDGGGEKRSKKRDGTKARKEKDITEDELENYDVNQGNAEDLSGIKEVRTERKTRATREESSVDADPGLPPKPQPRERKTRKKSRRSRSDEDDDSERGRE